VIEGVRAALSDAVACHLMSEVPLGAFLSGGIDSSAVVGTMARLTDRPVRTASIGFREDAYDELPFARQVAAAFGADAHERIVEAHAADILALAALDNAVDDAALHLPPEDFGR